MKNMLWCLLLLWSAPLFSQDTIEWMIPLGTYNKIKNWNGYFLVRGKGGWGMLDENLKTVIAPQFDDMGVLGNWALAIKEKGNWGFRHRKNILEWAIQPLYKGDYFGPTRDPNRANSWLYTKDERKWAIVATEKEIVVEDPGAPIERIVQDIDAEITAGPNASQPLKPKPWHSKWAEVYPVYNFYDEQKIYPNQDVFEIIDKEQRHGMADAKGRVLIPARYAQVQAINAQTVVGIESVESDPNAGCIFFRRSDGKRMSSKKYNTFRASRKGKNGPIQVWERPSRIYEDLYCGLLSSSGEERVPCEYEYFEEETPPGFVPAMKYRLWGLVSIKNKVLLPLEYKQIILTGLENSSLILVLKDDEMGVLRVK